LRSEQAPARRHKAQRFNHGGTEKETTLRLHSGQAPTLRRGGDTKGIELKTTLRQAQGKLRYKGKKHSNDVTTLRRSFILSLVEVLRANSDTKKKTPRKNNLKQALLSGLCFGEKTHVETRLISLL